MKYFTAGEIAQHNSGDDCWVSIFDDIYDITPLIEANKGNDKMKYGEYEDEDEEGVVR
jgi:cytochrome b involved in lipid metabolism